MIEPYYKDEFATLYLADCRVVLPTIERESMGALITDPPYGIGYQSNYGKNHDAIAGDDGQLDVMAIIDTAARTLRRNRHLYVFGFTIEDLEKVECVTGVIDLIWDKGMPGMGDLTSLYARSTEPIAFGVFEHSKANRAAGKGQLSARLRRGSVLRCNGLRSGQNTDHPTGKPVALIRQLVESSTMLGDVVLDPFAGAGSTLVAAVTSGRQAMGIELDERYCERAARRLKIANRLRLELEAA